MNLTTIARQIGGSTSTIGRVLVALIALTARRHGSFAPLASAPVPIETEGFKRRPTQRSVW